MREPANSTYAIYPAPGGAQFVGRVTNEDPCAIPDTAASAGQNVFDNNGDQFSVRPFGLQIFPSTATPSTASGGYRSMKTFRMRTGENILLGARGTVVEWFDETSQTFVTLQSGRASDDYGWDEFNINADAESRLYFGNGIDSAAYWTGGHNQLNGPLVGGEVVVTVDSTASFTAAGNIIIGGASVTYSGITATTFTGCSGVPAAADNTPVAQEPVVDGSAPKGNIYMAGQNRLFIAGLTANPQLVLFSAYGNASSWSTNTVTASTATAAGAFNLVEGGGKVTAMCQDEKSLYFLKDSMIYAATLTDSLYSLVPLKPFDSRSRAVGAVGKRAVFIGGNFVFVVTPDNQIKALQRLETIDYPQLKPISYVIQPDCDGYDFSLTTGISFRDYAYFACKSSPDVATNDRVLPFNLVLGQWEQPIVGWQVGEWAIYNSGDGDALYFGDANSPNVWKVVDSTVSDGPYIVTASRTTKRYDFGDASEQKLLSDVYVEGYISPDTALTITLLLDEDGYTSVNETTFLGSETAYIVGPPVANTFGVTPFGTEVFGAEGDLTGLAPFRVHLCIKLREVPFYVAQLRFSSSGTGQMWSIKKYGFKVRPSSQPMRSSLMRNFS